MKKNGRIITLALFSIFTVAIVLNYSPKTGVQAEPKVNISAAFDQIKAKTQDESKVKNSTVLAEGSNITIPADEFKLYRANVEFIAKMNNAAFTLTNQEILEKMIKKELLVRYAKDNGVSVSGQELVGYIEQNKNDLQKLKPDMQEIMKNRVRISGLSVDEFYQSPLIKRSYENILYTDKLYDLLLNKGTVKSNKDFENFSEQLWTSNKSKVQINTAELNKIQ